MSDYSENKQAIRIHYFCVEEGQTRTYNLKIESIPRGQFKIGGFKTMQDSTTAEETLTTMGKLFSKAYQRGEVAEYYNGHFSTDKKIRPLTKIEEKILLKALKGE